MPYICTKFHEESLNGFKVIELTWNIAKNKQRDKITSEQKVGLWFFFSAYHLIMPYICTKFHKGILNGFKVIERALNIAWNIQTGIIMSELKVGLQFFFSANCLITPYIGTRFQEEILNHFKAIEQTRNIAIWTLSLKCDLDLWKGLVYEFCTPSWYSKHLSRVAKDSFNQWRRYGADTKS